MSARKHIWWEARPLIMQVTCPNCAARYAVDPLAIGPAGPHRPVRPLPPSLVRDRSRPRPPRRSGDPPPSDRCRTSAIARSRTTMPAAGITPRRAARSVAAVADAPRPRWSLVLGAAAFAYRDEIAACCRRRMARASSASTPRAASSLASPAEAHAPPRRAGRSSRSTSPRSRIERRRRPLRRARRDRQLPAARRARPARSKLIFRKRRRRAGRARLSPLVDGPIAPGARLSFSQALDDPPDGTTDIVPTVE